MIATRIPNSTAAQFVKRRIFCTGIDRCSHSIAIARAIPDSFGDALVQHTDNTAPVSVVRARQQHDEYINALRKVIPTLTLPALDDQPDCCFVEDTVVAIGNVAVRTTPGHVSRQEEGLTVASALEQLGVNVTIMNSVDASALCDGGDVLFTGRHLFVGLSHRTNEAGADVLRHCFSPQHRNDDASDFSVRVVDLPSYIGQEVLHLKSMVTHLDERTLLVPEGPAGDALLEAMQATALGYEAIRLPDVHACNVVVLKNGITKGNSTVLIQASADPASLDLLTQAAEVRQMQVGRIDTSELAKKDGALTCCSVLLNLL